MMSRTTLWALGLLLLTACETSTARGANGEELTLTSPADQWLRRGTSNNVAVQVARKGFDDPVEVRFLDLPVGVELVDTSPIASGDSIKNYTLRVAQDAPLVQKRAVTVVASSRGMRIAQKFDVDVSAP